MLDRIKTYATARPPVVPVPAQCVACGVRGGVTTRLVGLDYLTLCDDFRACSARSRADDLAMLALDGAV